MKISFYTKNPSDKSGSYRIWVKDLSTSLNELGYESNIYTNLQNIPKDSKVIIFCKSAYKEINLIKSKNFLIGAINIDKNFISDKIDFVIVGSLEEYTSMSSYENVFIYPLIERKFQNIERKVHIDKDFFSICFHGNYPHLFKFEPFLKKAIEKFDKEIKKVKLKVITGNPNFKWEIGRPNVKIEMYDYNDNFINIVQSCDIGVVPNVSDIRLFVKDIDKVTSVDYGLYSSDYFLRMKNKSNAGRAYVFYQLGIPVVHDISPSSFELMCKTNYNICGHDEKSYFREFKKLSSDSLRNEIAIKNKNVFEQYYNPLEHAKKLIKNIGEINGKNR